MSQRPEGVRKTVTNERQKHTEATGEPLRTFDRSVIAAGGSHHVTLPKLSVEMWNLDKGDTVEVESHEHCIVLKPKAGDVE
jgi:hypothetical protein